MKDSSGPRVLFVEDEAPFRMFAGSFLEENGFRLTYAENAAIALEAVKSTPHDLVLLDLNLPDQHGLEVLRRIRSSYPQLRVIVLTAYGDAETAVKALKAGATDYLTKPIELDRLLLAAREALKAESAVAATEAVKPAEAMSPEPCALVGEDPGWLRALARLERVASSDLPTVLLLGESGTGKTALARHFHGVGGRRTGGFVEVDCLSIPEALLESEFFGYEPGAFKGADTRKRGVIELANEGTLFLDEIGRLPQAFQAKLLRFLEQRTFRRLGSDRELQADVRLVCATNRDIKRAVERGSDSFRRDLFYRLEVVSIELPPLRERGDDVILLAEHFLTEVAAGSPPPLLADGAREALIKHPFPGNVRELQNLMRRSAAFVEAGAPIRAEDLDLSAAPRPGATRALLQPVDLEAVLDAIEARYVEQAMTRSTSQRQAGSLLSLDRFALGRRRNRVARSGGSVGADTVIGDSPSWVKRILSPHPTDLPAGGLDLLALRSELEQRAIVHALRAMGNNRARAATLLGMSRTSLGRRLEGGET
jgi:two-component system, NtrC family, response regulator AtoC